MKRVVNNVLAAAAVLVAADYRASMEGGGSWLEAWGVFLVVGGVLWWVWRGGGGV